ncbi:SGNH hydrolase-type esterase domain-containing protein [Umbelopsis sp. PMI_123]|nr:SGNH hydrolase-type esterase domain-containing protein [Umbelopsis sp. PMI_123]
MLFFNSCICIINLILLFIYVGIPCATAYALLSPIDSNIHYYGRWNQSDNTMISWWPGAYAKFNFTGTTLAIKLRSTADILYKIDEGDYVQLVEASETIQLAKNLKPGLHSAMIASKTEKDSIQLQKIIVDNDAKIKPPEPASSIIEFVGDSITAGLTTSRGALTSYAWLVADMLAMEHTQIAYPAACLVDGCNDAAPGMESQYFKWKGWHDDDENWDFSRYTPSAIVIMLGSNDEKVVGPDADRFQEAYATFLQRIRNEFAKAHIFIVSEPLGALFAPTQAAVRNLTLAGDKNMYFVDSTPWVQYGKAFNDEAHPSDYGHQLIAKKLFPYLQAKLAVPPQPLPGPPPNPNLPGLWQTMDIGGEDLVGLPGSVSFDSADTFTLWGSGRDIGSTQDAFRFVYQPATTSTVVTVMVESHSAFATCAKAGIMIREHLASSSPNVILGMSPADGIIFQSRPIHSMETKLAGKVRGSSPCHLKLERKGHDFFGSWSTDGKTWEPVAELRGLVMANDYYVGLAVTSCDPSVVSVAKFSQVKINGEVSKLGNPHLILQPNSS